MSLSRPAVFCMALLLLGGAFARAQEPPSDSLATRQDTIETAYIRDTRTIRETYTQTSLKRIDGDNLGKNFAVFGAPDLIKSLQMLPGVAAGSELMTGLYVRGGDGSDNLFLLDGVPMYQVSHLIGLFSSFNTDIIDYADFYKGGFPARFGGRLSSVVDVGVKEGSFSRWSGNASLGSVDGRFQLEGPLVKGRTSLNFGLRRTWTEPMQYLAILFIDDEQTREMARHFHYDFGDFNLKLVHKFTPSDKLSLSLYYGQDLLKALMKQSDEGTSFDMDYLLRWGNTLASLRYDKRFDDRLEMSSSLWYTRYSSRMIFDTQAYTYDDDQRQYLHLEENNLSRVQDIGANIDFYHKRLHGHHLRWGGSVIAHVYDPTRSQQVLMEAEETPAYKEGSSQAKNYRGAELAAYLEDEISLGWKWKLNLGLRDVLYIVGAGKTFNRFEPRVALKYQANDILALKTSYSVMNQFTHKVSATYLDLPSNLWMPSTAEVKPMSSQQWVAGVELALPQNVTFDIEAFYKTLDHLYEYTGINSMLPQIDKWESVFEEGKGRSAGIEMSVEYRTEHLQAAAYYTLSRSERRFETFHYDWFPDRNDNLHRLNLTASYRFNKRFELYAAWVYHTGNRFTGKVATVNDGGVVYDVYGTPNCYHMPAYHRMDAGFNWHRLHSKGREGVLTLSVYNIYNHVNPVFAMVEEENGKTLGHYYGLIPIIPSLSYCYKF